MIWAGGIIGFKSLEKIIVSGHFQCFYNPESLLGMELSGHRDILSNFIQDFYLFKSGSFK